MDATLVLDSITELAPVHAGRVVACGSHGGLIAAYYAARSGVRGALFNDAGVGRGRAGVAAADASTAASAGGVRSDYGQWWLQHLAHTHTAAAAAVAAAEGAA